MEILSDLNYYYDASLKAEEGSLWKRETQKFENNFLYEIIKLRDDVMSHRYKITDGTSFILNERGKKRYVNGKITRDRTVGHVICDDILLTRIEPFLVSDNGASRKGMGISYVRGNFERDLHNFYLEYGDNNGYVVLSDFSKFYDNILHDVIREQIAPFLKTDTERWLFDTIIKKFEVDVSYMTDEEYERCMEVVFNSVEYYSQNYPQTGEKMMKKSVDIGDQVSQVIGIFHPTPYDNYLKTVKGYKRKHRYMDDTAIIVRTYDEALQAIRDIKDGARPLGINVNDRKTRICPLSRTFTYLQRRYFLTEKGKVVKRINRKSLKRSKDRIKAYRRLLDKGRMPYEDIKNSVKSWAGMNYKIMSKPQRDNVSTLYKELFKEELKWKK